MLGVPTWEWLTAALLLAGSAFFSGTETALVALGDIKARQLVEAGGRRARLLRLWMEHPDRVLSAVLVGNNVTAVGIGALAGEVGASVALAHGLSPATALAAATGLASVASLLVGEVVPKTLAKRHPVKVALLAMPIVHVTYWLLWPVSVGLARTSQGLLRLLGGGRSEATPSVTSEEIEYIIEVGSREGVLDEVKEELLNSVLEFADRVVKEIMVPRTRMVAIDRDAPVAEIVRAVTENPYSRMPVYQGTVDDVVGILLAREILAELRNGTPDRLPWERLVKPAFFVPEQMKISRLLKEMQRRKLHLAVVVDEFGGTSGIVTMEDVLEEIVGEIQDEADAEAAPVKGVGPGVWLADATVPLRELEEFLAAEGEAGMAVRFPEDGDYETLGGFVTAAAGRVPPVGASVDWDGFVFTVRGGDDRRVTRVEIARPVQAPPAAQAAVGSEA